MAVDTISLLRPGPLGLSLPNRAILFGAITVEQMFEMTETAEGSGAFDSVWVGDSLLAKPRLESVSLLAALAARTRQMALGPACMASFPLRQPLVLAQQWASLDVISKGRTILVPCIGSAIPGAGGDFFNEYAALEIDPKSRMRRLEEGIEVLRRLWSEDSVTYRGEYVHVENLTLEPKPVQRPYPPIWIASDPALGTKAHLVERAFRRVALYGDGWMTSMGTPSQWRERWDQISAYAREVGRDPSSMHTAIHHMVNINDSSDTAYREAKEFLDKYYTTDTTEERMQTWVSWGSPESVAAKLQGYFDAGVDTLILRFASWEPIQQIRRAVDDVVPRLRLPA